MKKFKDTLFYCFVLICSSLTLAFIVSLVIFLFFKGSVLFSSSSLWSFLFSDRWRPSETDPTYGVFGFLFTSLYLAVLVLIWTVPLGLVIAIYISEIAGRWIRVILRNTLELLASIPSVIFGFVGVVLVSSFLRYSFSFISHNTGYNLLTGAIVLGIMGLPTFVQLVIISLRSLPQSYRYAALALGANKWQSIMHIFLPAALKGVIVGVILMLGRIMGETIAILMVLGNTSSWSWNIFSSARTLTMNIITDIGYASGDHLNALFSTALVLFLLIFILNFFIFLYFNKYIQKLNQG